MTMRNYDESVEIKHNPSWSYICDHPYRILISGGSGSSKTNMLLNLIKYQGPDIDKFICALKIHSNQSINCYLIEEKKSVLKN